MTQTERLIVYIVSDSVGETAELVVKAAVSQFNGSNVEIRRIPYVEDKGTIQEVVQIAKKSEGVNCLHTRCPRDKKITCLKLQKKPTWRQLTLLGRY